MNQTLHPNPNIKAIKITLKDPRFFKTVSRARYRTGQLFFDDNEQLKLISTIQISSSILCCRPLSSSFKSS